MTSSGTVKAPYTFGLYNSNQTLFPGQILSVYEASQFGHGNFGIHNQGALNVANQLTIDYKSEDIVYDFSWDFAVQGSIINETRLVNATLYEAFEGTTTVIKRSYTNWIAAADGGWGGSNAFGSLVGSTRFRSRPSGKGVFYLTMSAISGGEGDDVTTAGGANFFRIEERFLPRKVETFVNPTFVVGPLPGIHP